MALSTARNTPTRADSNYINRGSYPMAASTTIFTGALTALNSSGYLVNGSATTGLRCLGPLGDQPFEVPGDRIVNAGSAGAKTAEVQLVQCKYDNSISDPVVLADVGLVCYIEDNQTVCHTASGKSIAGKVMAIDDASSSTGAGVWFIPGENSIGGVGSTGAQGPQGATGTQGPQGPQGATGA